MKKKNSLSNYFNDSKSTLAPVIGGSERQGFRKHSLCSEKKEQITQSLQIFLFVCKSLAFSKGP